MNRALLVAALLLCGPALAQTSSSFKQEEHTFNAGGHPRAGAVLTSLSFKITFDALGDGLAAGRLVGGSFSMCGGFGSLFPPPGEVTGLLFSDKQTAGWDPESSVGSYRLYRDLMSNLLGLGFGQCEQQGLTSETISDTDPVPVDDGFFYLVTALNRLTEEGTKGFRSSGIERAGSVCP